MEECGPVNNLVPIIAVSSTYLNLLATARLFTGRMYGSKVNLEVNLRMSGWRNSAFLWRTHQSGATDGSSYHQFLQLRVWEQKRKNLVVWTDRLVKPGGELGLLVKSLSLRLPLRR